MRKATARHRAKYPERVVATNRARRPQKAAWNRQKRYGLTEQEFEVMFARQKGRCAGCGVSFEKARLNVDHDHKTGKVRGLLCHGCNAALGLAKESPAALYQLAAYLELDRSRPVVYLIGSLRNPKVVELGNDIRSRGMECVDNWMAAGPIADDSWQEYSTLRGRSYAQALESREAKHVFHFDKAYIELADAAVLFYPAGKSAHLEFGVTRGLGKKGYILIEEKVDRYDVMLQFAGAPLFHERELMLERMQADLMGGKL